MSTTVHVKNINSHTSEKEVRDFFSFCGKISSISVQSTGNTQSAAVTFEKPTAAKTALLLDNTQLGPSLVQVTSDSASSSDYTSEKSGPHGASASTQDHAATQDYSEFSQEDKPRSRIVAEYLAHGYTISDSVIDRAIALDNQHGYSARFTSALASFDEKYHATDKTKELDAKYGVSEKVNQGLSGLSSYFEKALGTQSGQRVRDFYGQGSKQVLDVHNEARRLADLKSGKSASGAASESVGVDEHLGGGQNVPMQDMSTEQKAKKAME